MTQTTPLPEDIIKYANLEGLTQISPQDAKKFEFINIGMLTISYHATIRISPHYLLKNDPWVDIGKGHGTIADINPSPHLTPTHYVLGPQHINNIKPEQVKNNNYTDHVPIAFFKIRDTKT
jgi:hypothetical protein